MDARHADAPLDDTPETRFGARLRGVREHSRLSVRRLAQCLGRAHSTISDFENGRRLPGVEVVEQYEDYFGLRRGTLGAQRERARAERLELPRDSTLDENLGDVACPYPGLRAFEQEDAGAYFGREHQVKEVLDVLTEARFVALVGASGCGKTSFIRAGVLAGIDRPVPGATATTRVVMLTPSVHPLDELAATLDAATGGGGGVTARELRAEPACLARYVREAGRPVIVVDQLEELFTLCTDEGERRCFIDALIAAWRDPAIPASLIVALRADFCGRLEAYPDLAAAVTAHRTLIGPLAPADLRRAIEVPAAGCGLTLQPGLVDTMLEDLADEPGALPWLSHALHETYKRRRRLMLTVGAYHEAGGVRGAIARNAERTLASLPRRDRAVARAIFLGLTEVAEGAGPTRRRVERADLPVSNDPARRERVLGTLAAVRLVTLDEHTTTVSHEALIRHWPRLRGWMDAERAGVLIHHRLRDAACQWDALGRETTALYRGAPMAAARAWATEHDDLLSRRERDFLIASSSRDSSEQQSAMRRAHRQGVLYAGLAVLTIVVATLTVSALGGHVGARGRAATRTSLALASASAHARATRPDAALLLTALRASPGVTARGSVLMNAALARLERVVIGLPLLGQPRDRARRQPRRVAAERIAQGGAEGAGGQAVQMEHRQHLRDPRRARRSDPRAELLALAAVLVDALVVEGGRPDRRGP